MITLIALGICLIIILFALLADMVIVLGIILTVVATPVFLIKKIFSKERI